MENLLKETSHTYANLNKWISEKGNIIQLIDYLYPGHNGIKNVDAESDLMLLRENLFNLKIACNMAIEHIDSVLEIDD